MIHLGNAAKLSRDWGPPLSHRVYESLERQADAALRSGQSVIIDATFLNDFEAHAVSDIASKARAEFRDLWLEAPTGLLAGC